MTETTQKAEEAAIEARLAGTRYNADVGYWERDGFFYDSDGYKLDDSMQSELEDMIYQIESGEYDEDMD